MKTTVQFNSFFGYSETTNKYFYTSFHPFVNIVQGPNTSGKSTFFQLMLFVFGINDNNEQLSEVLKEGAFFRLDCTVKRGDTLDNLTLMRDSGTLVVKFGFKPILRFNGINANQSAEHIKLKHTLHDLFGFDLHLESKGEYKAAPIEALFLPYYIAQSVGWVYLRKSFSALDFYRNLKEDYLDYYLGIASHGDRLEKQNLETEKQVITQQIAFLTSLDNNDVNIQVTKLTDESFLEESKEYLEVFADRQSTLVSEEKKYISHCNTFSHLFARKSILAKVKRNIAKQSPALDNCPACSQKLPASLEDIYSHEQAVNDTEAEQAKIKKELIHIQGEMNSLNKAINTSRDHLAFNYEVLNKVSVQEVNFETWIQHKATVKLVAEIKSKSVILTNRLSEINKKLAGYKTSENIILERKNKEDQFRSIFLIYLKELNVMAPTDRRYLDLYKISAFPTQGVELHKTVMAYHLATNKLFGLNNKAHRLPLMLDAIFKEDIDSVNKNDIIRFLSKNGPQDTQLFISMAQLADSNNPVNNSHDFSSQESKTITIGDGTRKRSLFKVYQGEMEGYLEESFNLLNSI